MNTRRPLYVHYQPSTERISLATFEGVWLAKLSKAEALRVAADLLEFCDDAHAQAPAAPLNVDAFEEATGLVLGTDTRKLAEHFFEAQAPAATAPHGWQSIETALKDRPIVLWSREWLEPRVGTWFEPGGNERGWWAANTMPVMPTHWIELPPTPPAAALLSARRRDDDDKETKDHTRGDGL